MSVSQDPRERLQQFIADHNGAPSCDKGCCIANNNIIILTVGRDADSRESVRWWRYLASLVRGLRTGATNSNHDFRSD